MQSLQEDIVMLPLKVGIDRWLSVHIWYYQCELIRRFDQVVTLYRCIKYLTIKDHYVMNYKFWLRSYSVRDILSWTWSSFEYIQYESVDALKGEFWIIIALHMSGFVVIKLRSCSLSSAISKYLTWMLSRQYEASSWFNITN